MRSTGTLLSVQLLTPGGKDRDGAVVGVGDVDRPGRAIDRHREREPAHPVAHDHRSTTSDVIRAAGISIDSHRSTITRDRNEDAMGRLVDSHPATHQVEAGSGAFWKSSNQDGWRSYLRAAGRVRAVAGRSVDDGNSQVAAVPDEQGSRVAHNPSRLRPGRASLTSNGGGLIDNLPRILPEDCNAVIETKSWSVPVIPQILEERGCVPRTDMDPAPIAVSAETGFIVPFHTIHGGIGKGNSRGRALRVGYPSADSGTAFSAA